METLVVRSRYGSGLNVQAEMTPLLASPSNGLL
jgi:hypothetical protein